MLRVVFYQHGKTIAFGQDAQNSSGAIEMKVAPRVGEKILFGTQELEVVEVIHFLDGRDRYDLGVHLKA